MAARGRHAASFREQERAREENAEKEREGGRERESEGSVCCFVSCGVAARLARRGRHALFSHKEEEFLEKRRTRACHLVVVVWGVAFQKAC